MSSPSPACPQLRAGSSRREGESLRPLQGRGLGSAVPGLGRPPTPDAGSGGAWSRSSAMAC
eukprot:11036668-Alexandrium_andersonii.AAC.1